MSAAERPFDWEGLDDLGAVDEEPPPADLHLARGDGDDAVEPERPAFLRKFERVLDRDVGWLCTCPVHAQAGFPVVVMPNEKAGRYTLTCLEGCEDKDLLRALGIDAVELGTLELQVATLEEFAAVDEEGAEPLLGDADNALFPKDGDVMVYGDGGAGKTTLTVDGGCHLAAGDDWLGITVGGPVRVLLIENEGPRPLFRKKLRRKLAGWKGSPIEGRLHVLERPWGKASFADPVWQAALAAKVKQAEIDVVIAGPLTQLGMNEAGTLQQVRDFMALVAQVRAACGRPLTVVLIHHENKGGQVSGAWEAAGDTLFHLTAQGQGQVRLFVQKARWASEYHRATLHLRWTDGEGFEVEDKPELDDEAIAELIVDYVRENAGTGWTNVSEAIKGVGNPKKKTIRDRLLAGGQLVNVGKGPGGGDALVELKEKVSARLYVTDDPTIQHLRPASGADGAQTVMES